MASSNEQAGFLGNVIGWFAHPFQSTGSAWNWVLFIGLVIVAIWFWQWMLLNVTRDL